MGLNVQQIMAAASLVASLAPVMSQVISAVFGTVRGIETALPASDGKTKFDAAMTTLEAIFGEVVQTAGPLFGGLVNGAVATLNAIGEFKKVSSGTTPPAA